MNTFCKPYKIFTHQKITQGYIEGHQAIDCVAPFGTPMVATEDSVVERIVTPNRLLDERDMEHIRRGYGIVLKGKSGLYTLFWHCMSIFPVSEGESVSQGKIVAYMGNSGFVYSMGRYVPIKIRNIPPYNGTHLHWEAYRDFPVKQYINPVEQIDWNIKVRHNFFTSTNDYLISAKVVLMKMLNLFR